MQTRALAKFVADLKYENLQENTVRMTKQCILDWLGVCVFVVAKKSQL